MDTIISERDGKFYVEVHWGKQGNRDLDTPTSFDTEHIDEGGPFDTKEEAEQFVARLPAGK